MAKHGVSDEHIVMRVTGCPNGCGRAMLAEVGTVGKSTGSLQSASWRQPHWDTYPTDV